jgi:hypothetical protein
LREVTMLDIGTYRRYRAVAENGVAHALSLDILSENEETFLHSMQTKFQQYRRNTFLSPKQIEWLDQIESKLQDELGSVYEEYQGE